MTRRRVLQVTRAASVTAVLAAACAGSEPADTGSAPQRSAPVAESTSTSATTTAVSEATQVAPTTAAPSTTVPPTTSATAGPTTSTQAPSTSTTTTTIPVEGEPVVLEAGGRTARVSARPTTAPTPPSSDGFNNGLLLPDGGYVAFGWDSVDNGEQLERSAIWTSVDGVDWDRNGREVTGETSSQDTIGARFVSPNGAVHAVMMPLRPSTGVDAQWNGNRVDDAVEWVSNDGGATWNSIGEIRNTFVASAVAPPAAERVTLFGTWNPNRDGLWRPVILTRDASGGWSRTDLEPELPDGHLSSGAVRDVLVSDQGWFVIGRTARTDPGGANAGILLSPFDERDQDPVDPALWRSDDGDEWTFIEISEVAGRPGWGASSSIAEAGGVLWLTTSRTSVAGDIAELFRSDDAGFTWARVDLPTATALYRSPDDDGGAVLCEIDGLLVALESRFSDDDGSAASVQTIATIVDPVSMQSTSADITDLIDRVEGILDLADGSLGFGRSPTEGATDVQVINIVSDRGGI